MENISEYFEKNAILWILICILPHISFADCRINDLQEKIEPTYITTPNGTCGAYTASARPTLNSCNECCESNWNIGASLLYWQGKTCANKYAYGKQHTNLEIEYELQDVPLSLPTKGNLYNVDSQWNYGFKVAPLDITLIKMVGNLIYPIPALWGKDRIKQGLDLTTVLFL